MTHRLFTYGTLMFPDVMKSVTGQIFPSLPATLPGYRCFTIKNQIFPAIIKSESHITNGILYEGIDTESLKKIDEFEDDFYERKEVIVKNRDGIEFYAWTYVLSDQCQNLISDIAWDKEKFKECELRNI